VKRAEFWIEAGRFIVSNGRARRHLRHFLQLTAAAGAGRIIRDGQRGAGQLAAWRNGGWQLRHGGKHDVYQHPARSRHRGSPAPPCDCESSRMDDVSSYGVVIDGRRGGYGVVFPDLPGCTAMGRTLDEALRHAMEAAAEWVQKPIPRPPQLRDDADVKQALTEGAVLAVVPF
jgi:predicted RNase H-like HicB family nuclease